MPLDVNATHLTYLIQMCVMFINKVNGTAAKSSAYLMKRIFKQRFPRHGDLDMARQCICLQQQDGLFL